MLAGPPPSFNTGTLPSTMQRQTELSSSMYPNQFRPPVLPPNFSNNLYPPPQRPPTHPSNVSGNQQQFHSEPATMSNGMGQTPMNHSSLNSGLPPSSTQIQSISNTSNQFDASLTTSNSQLANSQPPLSNQSLSHINGTSSYPQTQYSHAELPYNGPPVNRPSLPKGYPTKSHYPNIPVSSSVPNNQLNGLNSYPVQPPSHGPIQQPFAQSRIDPDMLPNVIQLLEKNQEKFQEPFITNTPGLLPPLVGTNFVCHDQGSCSPRLMRSTVYAVPNTTDMIKQSQIPIALSVSPLANLRSDELEPPLTNFGEIGPVRCRHCKAYMCSFMKFIDGGKRFVCCFCEASTDVPNEYFNHLDHNGRRIDCYKRPELCLGSYEILATKQYCKNEKWPEPPAFIFMIDVSYNSICSGLVEYICHILKTDLLDYLPKEKNADKSTVRVGFATFDKQIHFYNIKNTLGQPQMMIVSDLEDMFIPLLDGFLCSPYDSRVVINSLLDQIPQTFIKTQETETILAPVIQSGLQAFKGANCSGKMYIFSTTLPLAVAPGKLSNRDNKKLLGTEKEKILLSPVNNNIYTKLGEECAQNGCAIDLFVFSNNYYDLATISEVCRISGGEIYKFNFFSIENDGERLSDELRRNFQRMTVFDALMRVRTSAGIRPVDFLGNFYMTNTTEMIFGTIDSDKSVSVELKHDDKLAVDNNTYIQVALLYTSISGQRRLRILTLALTVTSSYTSLYSTCDLDTIMNYITKIAIRSIPISTPKSIRENIITQAANILACYRKYCAQETTGGQLILPDTLKLLPVYIGSLIKSDVLNGTQTLTTDDRSYLIHRLMSMNVKGTSVYLYPRIYPLYTLNENHIPPSMIRCSYERLSNTEAYLLENGLVTYIWLGSQLNPMFIKDLFGIETTSSIQADKCRIIDLDNPISKNVRTLLNIIRNERNSYMKLFIIQQHDSMELFFKNYLVEDKGLTNSVSYVDFVYHLHREIRNILQ